MTVDTVLNLLVIILVPFGWVSAVILSYAAKDPPRVGVLTERTAIAFAIAIMLTSGGLINLNRTLDFAFFPVEVARLIFSLSIIVLGAVPVGWVYLWFRNRLGQSDV